MTAAMLSAVTIMSCYGIDPGKIKHKKIPVEGNGFAVIELFTSEGCSSCPAADNLVSKVLKEHKNNVYILSYHVDYWNRLGWKDEFSQAAFSERQKQYAGSFSLESIYTPQIIVNGTAQFTGSDEARLRSSITNSQSLSGLSITTESVNAMVKINYAGAGSEPVVLNVALVQPEAITDVKSGENSGRKLHHVNIVRELKTITTTADAGSVDIQIPKELAGTPLQLTVFVQQKIDMKITGVMQVNL